MENTKKEIKEWIEKYFEHQGERCINDFNRIKKFCSKNDKILEIGSSPFITTKMLIDKKYDVIGIDVNTARFEGIVDKDILSKIKEVDIEKKKLPFKDNSFDTIILCEVFEHLKYPLFVIDEISRVLKRGGTFYFTTPSLYKLSNIKKFVTGKGLNFFKHESLVQEQELGHRGHIREYSKEELEKFLKKDFYIKRHLYESSKESKIAKFLYLFSEKFKNTQIFICRKK